MPKFLNNLDLAKNQLLNALVHNVAGADPGTSTTEKGLLLYNTTSSLAKVSNGATWDTITNVLESVTGAGAISVGAVTAKSQSISIAASSGSVPGTMSAAHYSAVAGATATSSPNTIVQRDASNNFAANTITAALTGTASNATQLNSQAASWYLDRTNHTSTQLASTISNFDTQVRTSRLDQMAAPTADVSLNTRKLINVLDPVSAQDAATKAYVDATAVGLDVKSSVRVSATGNLAAGTYNSTGGTSGRGQWTAAINVVDGITLAAGNRVLLKEQTTAAQNGIYVVTVVGTGVTGVWDRAPDFDADPEVTSGAFVFIEEGTNAAEGYVLTTANPITIGGAAGTAIAFTQFSGAGTWIAGNGLTLTGQTFDVVGTAARVSVAANAVDIDAAYVGQASITTLGTIATGTWAATDVGIAYGGTGASTAATARTNLNVVGRAVITAGTGIVPDAASVPVANCAATLGNASLTTFVVTHDRATKDVRVVLTEVATDKEVFADVTHTSTSTVTVVFAVAPTSAQYRIVIVG